MGERERAGKENREENGYSSILKRCKLEKRITRGVITTTFFNGGDGLSMWLELQDRNNSLLSIARVVLPCKCHV